MPKTLSEFQIKNAKKTGNYRIAPKTYLHVENNTSGVVKKFYIRPTIDGKRKWIYVGTYPSMTPKQARAKAVELLSSDRAPQEILREQKQKKIASAIRAEKKRKTFKEVTEEYISQIKTEEWTANARTKGDWDNKLNTYIYPVIGNKAIDEIGKDDIQKILLPIWRKKYPTAKKVKEEINSIINFAIFKEYSDKGNPCTFIKFLLPSAKHTERHHAALPFHDAPKFGFDLWNKNEASYDALKLILLTQVRSADAREALWTQFDLQSGVWMCPIKKLGGEVHKLPIPKKLLWSLQERIEFTKDERLFPGSGKNKFISSNALDKSLDVFSRTDAMGKRITIHGFRSTFMDWTTATSAGTKDDANRQLAHREKDTVLAAYMRTDLFDRRVKLLQEYEDFALSDVASVSH